MDASEQGQCKPCTFLERVPCAGIPTSVSVITSVVERHIQNHKLNPFVTVLMDEDSNTYHVMCACMYMETHPYCCNIRTHMHV